MEPSTIEDALALIEQHPKDAELYQELGKLYVAAGQMPEARHAFERSIELDPNDGFKHLFLGNWYWRQGLDLPALECMQRGVEAMPQEAVGHWLSADVLVSFGRYREAQEAYEAAVRVEPNNEVARSRLQEWNEACAGKGARARKLIKDACENDQAATVIVLAPRWLEANPDDLGILRDYISMLYQLTHYEKATEVCVQAIERAAKGRRFFYLEMGSLLKYRGDFSGAEPWFRKAIAEAPDDSNAYTYLGGVQARQGKLAEAEKTHRRGTQCTTGCIDESHHNLGLVLRGLGRLAEAAECFRKAIELCPDYPDAHEALRDVESAMLLAGNSATETGAHISVPTIDQRPV